MRTFQDCIHEYTEHLHAMRKLRSEDKAKQYLRLFAAWMESRGVKSPEALNAEILKQYHSYTVNRLKDDGLPLSPKTVNSILIYVSGFITYLSRRGVVSERLNDALPRLKEPQRFSNSVLSHRQARKLLSMIPTNTTEGYRNRTMLELLYSTGIRACEILGLSLNDVDFERRLMKVTGKGSKDRLVPVGKTAMKYLETYLKAIRPFLLIDKSEKAVFLNRKGRRLEYKSFQNMVQEVGRKSRLDIKVTAHTFRRSCATELIRGGAGLYAVKEILGHESLNTLQPYVRLTITDLQKTHEKCHPRERE